MQRQVYIRMTTSPYQVTVSERKRHRAGQGTNVWVQAESVTKNAPLAQLVEQLTLNQWVPGSSP